MNCCWSAITVCSPGVLPFEVICGHPQVVDDAALSGDSTPLGGDGLVASLAILMACSASFWSICRIDWSTLSTRLFRPLHLVRLPRVVDLQDREECVGEFVNYGYNVPGKHPTAAYLFIYMHVYTCEWVWDGGVESEIEGEDSEIEGQGECR